MSQQHQETQPEPAVTTPVPPVTFAATERDAMAQQVEVITNNVVQAVREVMKVAQDLENLVVQNAARVKTELDEHVALAAAVKQEAAQLGGLISKMRDVQAEVAVQRRNGQH